MAAITTAAAATLATSIALASCGDRTGLEVGASHDAASDGAVTTDGGAHADANGSRDAFADVVVGFDVTPIPFDSGDDGGPIPIYGAPPPPGSGRAGKTPDE